MLKLNRRQLLHKIVLLPRKRETSFRVSGNDRWMDGWMGGMDGCRASLHPDKARSFQKLRCVRFLFLIISKPLLYGHFWYIRIVPVTWHNLINMVCAFYDLQIGPEILPPFKRKLHTTSPPLLHQPSPRVGDRDTRFEGFGKIAPLFARAEEWHSLVDRCSDT
ncbi:hypothetical protein M747DRAFT_308684 [Aspergillus niger ATCC 13496]|uniref:Uncharacterized protein n=1 Tax=Aspergillus niger ATCC 13496 TaxID=1353008 RepID=A0A370BSD6_ASPNG|nr:hypothetical protein M747DRAFT_308684 [Aspergillus niger ATCC 13496]